MSTSLSKKRRNALTLIEVLIILAVIGVLAAGFLTWASSARARSLRINCVWELKSIGLAFKVWADDNNRLFPMSISQTNGGTKEFDTGKNAYRHFQVMSNELAVTVILRCPTDIFSGERNTATNWSYMNNSNVSFFVGLDAAQTNPKTILSGDRNISTQIPLVDGILNVSAGRGVGWTREMHKSVGNILLADMTVLTVSAADLNRTVANTGLATNRLQMPILRP